MTDMVEDTLAQGMTSEEVEEEQKVIEEVRALDIIEGEGEAPALDTVEGKVEEKDMKEKGTMLAMGRNEKSAQRPLVVGGLLQATPWLGSTNTLTFHFLDLIPLRQNPI